MAVEMGVDGEVELMATGFGLVFLRRKILARLKILQGHKQGGD